jgi:hypothetical protein
VYVAAVQRFTRVYPDWNNFLLLSVAGGEFLESDRRQSKESLSLFLRHLLLQQAAEGEASQACTIQVFFKEVDYK